MADQHPRINWSAIGLVLSSVTGVVGLIKYYISNYIQNATEVTSEELVRGKAGLFTLSGNIVATRANPVRLSQGVVLPEDYPNVVHSSYDITTVNQFGRRSVLDCIAINVMAIQDCFQLKDRAGLSTIHSGNGAVVFAIPVYHLNEKHNLSFWELFKILISSSFWWFLGPFVDVRSEICESILPANTSLDVVVRATQSPTGLIIEPQFLGVSRVHMADFYWSSAKHWLTFSVGLSLIVGFFKIRSMLKAQLIARETQRYARWRDTVPEELICTLCLDNPRDQILYPCNHVCVCRVCSLEITNCPICRRHIERRVPIRMQEQPRDLRRRG